MKKLLALMLAAALVLSLAACGGGDNAGDNSVPSGTPSAGDGDTTSTDTPSGGGGEDNEASAALALNDTATIGDWRFTLTSIEFGDAVTDENNGSYYLRPADDEYKSGTGNAFYTADSGKVFLFFTAEIGYSGKETAEIGSQSENYIGFEIHYGDGYTFDTYEFAINDGNELYTFDSTFEPLGQARQCKGYFEVPLEIQNSMDNPLELVVTIQNFDGVSETCSYNLR